jgi:hypothetical protein
MCSLSKIPGPSGPCRQSDKSEVLLFALLAVCFLARPAQAQYGGGSGTENDPYLIYTAEQMNQIGANPGDWGKRFELMADIDLSDYSGSAFNIIGTTALASFNGLFEGNGHTISNFSLTSTSESYVGLFGYVSGKIQNLGLIDPYVFAQGRDVGSLAGYLEHGTIAGCYATGVEISGDDYVAGLVGWSTGQIVNCSSSGSVHGDTNVGGLVGLVADGTVTASYSRAGVSGNMNVGGLAGRTSDEAAVISGCYASGSVMGGTYVGGLIGQIERGRAYKSYSTGSVSGAQYVGGFTGYIRVLGSTTYCFWDTQSSGQATSAGEEAGKTTAGMQTKSTFTDAGWDFNNIWEICPGTNYPVLQWQIPIADFRCPDGVSFVDFAFFAGHWLDKDCNAANYYCRGTDLDHSGSVGFSDLEIFADYWLEGIP